MIKTYAVVGSAKPLGDLSLHYIELKQALNNLGFIEASIESCDYVIFVNYNRKLVRKHLKPRKDSIKSILIRLEPRAVLPIQYTYRVEKNFDLILDPGAAINPGTKHDFISWPYSINKDPSCPDTTQSDIRKYVKSNSVQNLFQYENWKSRSNKMVLISANKVSPTSKSNYKIRRQIAKKIKAEKLHIYGHLWNAPIREQLIHRIKVFLYAIKTGFFPNIFEIYGGLFKTYNNYFGEPVDKHEVARRYMYSLIIENDSNYSSEKLFDAILNASIPVYVGPKSENLLLPSTVFSSSGGSVKSIQQTLEAFTQDKCIAMLNSMLQYINSDDFLKHRQSDKVYSLIAQKILELK